MPARVRRRAVGPPGAPVPEPSASPIGDREPDDSPSSAAADDDERLLVERPPHHDRGV